MRIKKLLSLFIAVALMICHPLGTIAETASVQTDSNTGSQEVQNISSEEAARPVYTPAYSGIDRVNIYDSKDTQMLFSVLKTLRIMDSYESLDAVLTRGQFASIIARIMQNGTTENVAASRYEFKDVDETTKNRSAIIYLTNYGIIQGDGQGYFYPDNNIKNTEAVIMLLNMMGYYEIAQHYGGGLAGYRKLANKLAFSREISMSEDSELTVEAAIKLIYHALHERVVDSSGFTNNSVTFETSDETLMYRYMNIMTVEGVVDANEYTSLYSAGGAVGENNIKIGETKVNFSDSDIVASDYLGLYSRIYVRENSGAYTAVFAEVLKNRQGILKINAKDIKSYNPSTKTLTYEEKERTRTQVIPVDASIIFNGVAVSGGLGAHSFTPEAGQLVFIDSNNDSRYDCIMIDSYTTYLVKKDIKNDEDVLYDELSVQPMISLNNKKIRVMKNNAEASVSDVKAGNVAMVASNKVTYEILGGITYTKIDTTSDVYSILVSDYQINGLLDAFCDDNIVSIDGLEYEYSKGFIISSKKGISNKTTDSMVMNVNVTVGLDLDGNIAWLERASDSSLKYGYLVEIAPGVRSSDKDQIMIYTQDNEMKILDFADYVNVFAHWGGRDINVSSYYSKRIKGNEVTDISMLYSDGESVQQLLQYKLNSDGKVSSLYIAANDRRDYTTDVPMLYDNVLYKSASLTDTIFYNYLDIGGVISPLFEYSKTQTFGFVVPDNPNITEEKYFSVHKNEITLFYNGSEIENIDLYNVDNGRIGAFVYKQPVSVGESDDSVLFDHTGTFTSIIVENVRQVRNNEDEFVTVITAYDKNKLQEFTFTSGKLVSHINENVPELDKVKVSELKRGDIVLIHQNSLGEIDGFKVVHRVNKAMNDAGESSIPGREQIWDGSAYEETAPVFPALFSRGEVVKSINGVPYVHTGRSDNLLRRMLIYGWTNQIIIYDVENDEMIVTQDVNKRGDFSQLQEGDYLFWYQNERAVVSAIALRNYK